MYYKDNNYHLRPEKKVEIRFKYGHKKEPPKWLFFYPLVVFALLFLSDIRLPVENLLEVVSLRVCDTHCFYSLVVFLSHVVSDVLVVVLSST